MNEESEYLLGCNYKGRLDVISDALDKQDWTTALRETNKLRSFVQPLAHVQRLRDLQENDHG